MQRLVSVDHSAQLWAEARGAEDAPTVLLIHGANASGVAWPDALVDRLAETLRVIRYDHRDTGRSTWRFDEDPYPLSALADDAIAVLDAFGVEQAHVVGLSLGGLLAQLLLIDAPDRMASATLFCTGPLADVPDQPEAPAPREQLLAFWGTMLEPRDKEQQAVWQREHARLLNGSVLPFDEQETAALEARVDEHAGHRTSTYAHARADQGGLERGAELANVRTPVLVLEATADPAYPQPNAELLAAAIPGARLQRIPGMGHSIPAAVQPALAEAVLHHVAAAVR